MGHWRIKAENSQKEKETLGLPFYSVRSLCVRERKHKHGIGVFKKQWPEIPAASLDCLTHRDQLGADTEKIWATFIPRFTKSSENLYWRNHLSRIQVYKTSSSFDGKRTAWTSILTYTWATVSSTYSVPPVLLQTLRSLSWEAQSAGDLVPEFYAAT